MKTVYFNNVYIKSTASVVGPREANGPMKDYFDVIFDNPLCYENTWEAAECRFQKVALNMALQKANLKKVDTIMAGDLLNQITASSYAVRNKNIPFIGIYGACSTFALAAINAGVYIENGFCNNVAAISSSNFCAAERTYRFPSEYGSQRTMSAQKTVTASGCMILSNEVSNIKIESATIGCVKDLGIKDGADMGSAMAPAAADTVIRFLSDTNTAPNDYDLILTGDLGNIGSKLFKMLLEKNGYKNITNHNDCGKMIYDIKTEDAHSGGSGAGCVASVFSGKIYSDLVSGKLKNIIVCATGALLSPIMINQKETIPAVAHLINIKRTD